MVYCLEISALPLLREENASAARAAAAIAERLGPGEHLELRFDRSGTGVRLRLALSTAMLQAQARLELERSGYAAENCGAPEPVRTGVLLHRAAEYNLTPVPGQNPVRELIPGRIRDNPAALAAALLRMPEGSGVSFLIRRSGGLDANTLTLLRQQAASEPELRELTDRGRLMELIAAVYGQPVSAELLAAECAYAYGLKALQLPSAAAVDGSLFACAERLLTPPERSLTLSELGSLADVSAFSESGAIPFNRDTLCGKPLAPVPETGPRLRLGFSAKGDPVDIPLKLLRQHVFLAGAPGSGKGNELFSIALQLHKQNVPFLMIESAKEEFHHIGLSVPTLRTWRPTEGEYVFSPFSIPEGVPLQDYRASLLQMLRAAFRLDGPLEELFSSAMNNCYAGAGYEDGAVSDTEGRPFGLQEFMVEFRALLEGSGYSEKTKSDMETAGIVRLKRLLDRNPAVFDSSVSIPVDELIRGSNLLQLSCLTTVEAKQSFATLLLIALGAWLRAGARHCTDRPLRLVILMDESHNLLEGTTDSRGEVYDFAADFRNLLLELRSVGVGFVVADQSSRNIPQSISETCAVRLFMGSSVSSGIGDFAELMNLDETARRNLWMLGAGEGVCSFPGLAHPLYFQTDNLIDSYLTRPCPRRNDFLEKNPRLTLETFSECGDCPGRGRCSRDGKTRARQRAAVLCRQYGAALERALRDRTENGGKAARRLLAAILTAAEDEAEPSVSCCTLIQFARLFNRDRRIRLNPAALTADAEKLRSGKEKT